jgi:hypothetical protein
MSESPKPAPTTSGSPRGRKAWKEGVDLETRVRDLLAEWVTNVGSNDNPGGNVA